MPLTSWIATANDPAIDFPIQNLPYGVFLHADRQHIGVAIGDQILDLNACVHAGLLSILSPDLFAACTAEWLNPAHGARARRVGGVARPSHFPSPRRRGDLYPRTCSSCASSPCATRQCNFPLKSATTLISTHPSTTRAEWAHCSGQTILCFPTTSTSPSPITAAPLRSLPAEPKFAARTAKLNRPPARPALALHARSTSSSK